MPIASEKRSVTKQVPEEFEGILRCEVVVVVLLLLRLREVLIVSACVVFATGVAVAQDLVGGRYLFEGLGSGGRSVAVWVDLHGHFLVGALHFILLCVFRYS